MSRTPMHRTDEDDELTEMYGRFFGTDGEALSDEPIPIAKLVQLFRSSDPRIRSRVARMVGKYPHYQQFVAHRLQESDPRVRANAIESLWGVDTPVTRRYLKNAITDAHHRARINAIYGLYSIGDPGAIYLLAKESRSAAASFRAAAVWAMGQSADPRFTGLLKDMAADPDHSVRRVAELSAARIEERIQTERQKPRLAARILRARGPDPDWRSFTITLPQEVAHSVKTTDFIIEENGDQIYNFEVQHVTETRGLRLGIALPEKAASPWMSAVESVLKEWLAAANRRDSFAIMRYTSSAQHLTYTKQGFRAVYENRPDMVARQLAAEAPIGELHQTLMELASGLFAPDRAMLLFAETDPSGSNASQFCPLPELTSLVRGRRVPVHIIATADAEANPLRSAASALGGIFLSGAGAEEIRHACLTMLNSFRNCFEIRYLPENKELQSPGKVRATLYKTEGWIEEEADLL